MSFDNVSVPGSHAVVIPPTARDIMIDLETYDTLPTAAILSIGACLFDKDGVYDKFYCVVDVQSCIDIGMTTSEDTIAWWDRQTPEARVILDPATQKLPIQLALARFATWYKTIVGGEVWGNGADFDNAIMATAYAKCGIKLPWRYSDNRCFRTIKNGARMEQRTGVYHNALDDAITQAKYMIDHNLVPAR